MHKTWITISAVILSTLIQGVYGITVSGGGGNSGGNVWSLMEINADKTSAINSEMTISGAEMASVTSIIPTERTDVRRFKESHSTSDSSGNKAQVDVLVINGKGLWYGWSTDSSTVAAEHLLWVPQADSIKCTATATSGRTLSADVGIELVKGRTAGDYVSIGTPLAGTETNPTAPGGYYYGGAFASSSLVKAYQSAPAGTGQSIKIYGHAKDGTSTPSIDTSIDGVSGSAASFSGLEASSFAGTTTQVDQDVHINTGAGTSTAATARRGLSKTITLPGISDPFDFSKGIDLVWQPVGGTSQPVGNLVYYLAIGKSIQAGVNAIQPGDTIHVPAGDYSEQVSISKSLNLIGAGTETTTIDGSSILGSAFNIVNAPDVTLSGMTITGGNGISTIGGGIVHDGGILNLDHVSITGNNVWAGGGISNKAGTINLNEETIIEGNSANAAGGGLGGGVYNVDPGTINVNSGSFIKGNTALNPNSKGGGIYNSGTININGGSIESNNAYQGGGIYNSGALGGTSGTIKMNSGFIGGELNFADGVPNSAKGNTATKGGGIYNFDGAVTISSGSFIEGNSAVNGGGIYNEKTTSTTSRGTITLEGGSIDHNIAGTVGSVMGFGGGIYNDQGTITMKSGSLVDYNSAVHWGTGGGIYSSGGSITVQGASIANNGAFRENDATDGIIISDTQTEDGGGIRATNGCIITVGNGGTISNNYADMGGGIRISGLTSMVDITSGGSISANIGENTGGGIYSTSKVELNGGSITGNTAQRGGGIYTNYGSAAGTGVVTLNSGSITQNEATVQGGGIYCTVSAPVISDPTNIVQGNTGPGAVPDDIYHA